MKGTSGIRFDKPGIDPTDGGDDLRGIFTGAKRDLKSRKQELVRNAILDAAIALFEKKGFDQTDVAEIAEAAGISNAPSSATLLPRMISWPEASWNTAQFWLRLYEVHRDNPPIWK